MKKSPLDHIKIASPCSADWDEMLGDKCKRFCSQCELNVYNLSEMTQREAENFLFEAEGRVCVRLYRRQDGTVITQDCPVGWQAVKRKVSRVATATFGLIIGFFGGLWSFNAASNLYQDSLEKVEIEIKKDEPISNDENNEVLLEPNQLTNQKYAPFEATMGKPVIRTTEESSNLGNSKIEFSGGISNMDEMKFWIFTERYPKED